MPVQDPSKANRLLAAMPRKDRERMLDGCTSVELGFEEVLVEAGEPLGHVHFPTTGFISLLRRAVEFGRWASRDGAILSARPRHESCSIRSRVP